MPEAVQQGVVGAPGAADADREVEVHVLGQLALDLLAGGGADGLDHAAVVADQDALLGLGLDPHRGADGERALELLDLLDLDLDAVRDLLTRAQQDLLAHQLGQHHVLGLVGDVLGREVEGALGQQRDDVVEQLRDALAGARRDREDLGLGQAELARDLQRLHGARVVEPVDLVDRDRDRHPRAAERLGDEAVAGPAHALVAVDDEQRGVGFGQLGLDAPLHA